MRIGDQAGKVYVQRIRGASNYAVRFHQFYYLAPFLLVVWDETFPQGLMRQKPTDLGSSGRDRRPVVHKE